MAATRQQIKPDGPPPGRAIRGVVQADGTADARPSDRAISAPSHRRRPPAPRRDRTPGDGRRARARRCGRRSESGIPKRSFSPWTTSTGTSGSVELVLAARGRPGRVAPLRRHERERQAEDADGPRLRRRPARDPGAGRAPAAHDAEAGERPPPAAASTTAIHAASSWRAGAASAAPRRGRAARRARRRRRRRARRRSRRRGRARRPRRPRRGRGRPPRAGAPTACRCARAGPWRRGDLEDVGGRAGHRRAGDPERLRATPSRPLRAPATRPAAGRRGPRRRRRPGRRSWRAPAPSSRRLEVAVDHPRALAALVDRPDDQRLPAARVAGGEHAGDARLVRRRLDVAALVLLDAELVDRAVVLRVQEAHREQHEVGAQLAPGALDRLERRGGLGLGVVELADAPVGVALEVRRHDREVLLAAADRPRLLHRVAQAELLRPQRPRRAVVGALGGRLRQELELDDRRPRPRGSSCPRSRRRCRRRR